MKRRKKNLMAFQHLDTEFSNNIYKHKCPTCLSTQIAFSNKIDFKQSRSTAKRVDLRIGYCFDCHHPFIIFQENDKK